MSTSSNIVIPCLHHAINASMSGSFHANVFGVFGDDSNLQAVIGSASRADGNFDRNNNFNAGNTESIIDVSLAIVNENVGQASQAAYTIPALQAPKCEPSFHDAFDIVNIIVACLYL